MSESNKHRDGGGRYGGGNPEPHNFCSALTELRKFWRIWSSAGRVPCLQKRPDFGVPHYVNRIWWSMTITPALKS